VFKPNRDEPTQRPVEATEGSPGQSAAATTPAESYPTLRQILGETGFMELARLIRTTYEATEERRRREPSEPPWRDTGGQG